MAAVQCHHLGFAAQGRINGINHKILTGQRNGSVLSAANVVTRLAAKAGGADGGGFYDYGGGFVAVQVLTLLIGVAVTQIAIKGGAQFGAVAGIVAGRVEP